MKTLQERRKMERLSDNKEKIKRDLDKRIEEYGGFMTIKIANGWMPVKPEEQNGYVLTCQIKYIMQVLENKTKD